MLLMIDNYDSFTYNLVQYFGELGEDVRVYRNDAITLKEIAAMQPDRIVISPGPCSPAEAGISVATIKEFAGKLPLLGVCLGHQSIGAAFGGDIVHAKQLMHGKTSPVHHEGKGVFAGLPNPLTVVRYHSLAIRRETPARLPRSHGLDRRRRNHGRAPQGIRAGRRAVPSRIDRHRSRPRTAEKFLEGIRKMITPQEALQRTIEHREIFHDEMLHLMRQIMGARSRR
jgi:anthranilate synthase component 2